MKTQTFILKKVVRATTAAEAIALDADTPVVEVSLLDKPVVEDKKPARAIGYVVPLTNEDEG